MSLNFLFILTLCKKGPGTYPTLPALNEKGKYVIHQPNSRFYKQRKEIR